MTTKPTLFLAGHHGMVGSAIARSLQAGGLDRAQVELLTASRALAETIARVTGYPGALRFDPSKPDGPARKLLDVSRLSALGWRAGIELEDGLRETYAWFCKHQDAVRG